MLQGMAVVKDVMSEVVFKSQTAGLRQRVNRYYVRVRYYGVFALCGMVAAQAAVRLERRSRGTNT